MPPGDRFAPHTEDAVRARPAALLVVTIACASIAALLASAALALPPGLRTPGQAEASQIIKFTGETLNCVAIAVDEHSPKWAFIEFHQGSGCPASAHFPGLILAHDIAPQNANTVGRAWTAALKTAHPRCPLSHVPARVALAFGICTGRSARGRVPHL
jgi:hypothetical protein